MYLQKLILHVHNQYMFKNKNSKKIVLTRSRIHIHLLNFYQSSNLCNVFKKHNGRRNHSKFSLLKQNSKYKAHFLLVVIIVTTIMSLPLSPCTLDFVFKIIDIECTKVINYKWLLHFFLELLSRLIVDL